MSNVQIQPGGSPTPSLATVTTDQQTIFGAGTPQDPLRTALSGGSFVAQFNGFSEPQIGAPVVKVPTDTPPTNPLAICTVAEGHIDDTAAAATVLGLIVAVNEDGTVVVQYSGIVELTEAQWTAVTGGYPLSPEPYYADAPLTMIPGPPNTPGQYISQVGIAFPPNRMILSTPTAPQLIP